MKINIISLIVLFLILLVPFTLATCTLTLNPPLVEGDTATVTATCSAPAEQSQSYVMNWTNATGHEIQIDTGTTPAIKNTDFFETFSIPSDYTSVNGTALNVNMTGTELEGTATATISTAGTSDLIISDISITSEYFIGKYGAISFTVRDNNAETISNAQCIVDIVDGNNLPIISSGGVVPSQGNGIIVFSQFLTDNAFIESNQYKWDISCACFNASDFSSNYPGFCYNSTGQKINQFADGETQYPFTIIDVADKMIVNKTVDTTVGTGIWVENSLGYRVNMTESLPVKYQEDINWSVYNQSDGMAFLTAGEKFRFCMYVNNTFDGLEHIKLNYLHLNRNPGATVNVLNVDGSLMDSQNVLYNAIDVGNYEKCGNWLLIPPYIKGQNNYKVNIHMSVEGYEQNFEIISNRFTIFGEKETADYIPLIDITNVSTNYLGATATACDNIEVTMTYNFHGDEEDVFIAEYCFEQTDDDYLAGCYKTEINPDFGDNKVIFENITLPYFQSSGEAEVYIHIHKQIEHEKSYLVGYGDIEPNNIFTIAVDHSDTCKYSQNYKQELELRGVEALEGIENKTGTFKMEVNCPSHAFAGGNIVCDITAQVEDSQEVEKEVDFTCQISNATGTWSTINWNQMVNRTAITVSKSFAIPSEFEDGTSYTLQCYGDYYNLGSRRDSFSDTFTIASLRSSSTWFSFNGISSRLQELYENLPAFAKQIIKIAVTLFIILIFLLPLYFLFLYDKETSEIEWNKVIPFLIVFFVGIIILITVILYITRNFI